MSAKSLEVPASFAEDKKRHENIQRDVAEIVAIGLETKLLDEILLKMAKDAPAYFQEAHTEYVAASAELQKLGLPVATTRGRTGKTKTGRPSFWKGHEGFHLVAEVTKIRANKEDWSLARAIKHVVDHDPALSSNKTICNLREKKDKGRTLEARYQEAATYWALMFVDGGLLAHAENATAIRQRVDAAINRLTVAHDQWLASLPSIKHGGDFS